MGREPARQRAAFNAVTVPEVGRTRWRLELVRCRSGEKCGLRSECYRWARSSRSRRISIGSCRRCVTR